ncbi:hypothetical protein CMI46_02605 [Candidatus Pacearchaeota archaeon]|nr:hypothetical protein [Candidatus Pacearchaeota archaeon]|tara:strand:- start:4758 stop:5048 length:291 start_codon:yes stop_codon:yes gene_type:complete
MTTENTIRNNKVVQKVIRVGLVGLLAAAQGCTALGGPRQNLEGVTDIRPREITYADGSRGWEISYTKNGKERKSKPGSYMFNLLYDEFKDDYDKNN